MNLSKSIEYFNPADVDEKIHIIGCGSVGSAIAELLARFGLRNMVLYDFDIVEAHNIANQMFKHSDIGRMKTEAVAQLITEINNEAAHSIEIVNEGYHGQRLNGYVFLAVDNIDLRREICERNKMNRAIKAVFDFRTRLTDSQHYAADWSNPKQIANLIATMDFSHDEAHAATPTTACGTELGAATTVRMICGIGVQNFINFVTKKEIAPMKFWDANALEVF